MVDTVISVENLGKCYELRHKRSREPYTTFRDLLARQAAAPFKSIGRRVWPQNGSNGSHAHPPVLPDDAAETFWALRNMSFEVKQGDVVGIIGRNGAGKSTLLKLLSRITEPTEGRIRLRGRVASLLEVGTGFHPELTGRENIYLNGSILGMSRVEIRTKFDEIVAFAEVEKFLDTPVKRYSSGMYVRLAFAVAAHLEPEILIVDEVLAVGDAEFQKKCLGKMHDVATGGRTILFVSHNMQAVSVLCNRGMFLRAGSLEHTGSTKEVIDMYVSSFSDANDQDHNPDRRYGTGEYRFSSASPDRPIFGGANEKIINFEIERRGKLAGRMWICAMIVDSSGVTIAQCDSRLIGFWLEDCPRIAGRVRFTTPWLKPGSYRIDLAIGARWTIDYWEGACSLMVSPLLPYSTSSVPDASAHGLVFADFFWEVSEAEKKSMSGATEDDENADMSKIEQSALEI
jgi:lipopolysaccharide transport system ATP-binding protein